MQITKKRFFLPKEEKNQEVKTEAVSNEEGLFVQDEDEDEKKTTPVQSQQSVNSTISFEKFASDLQAIVGEISPVILNYLYDKYSIHPNSVKHATHELFTNPPDIDELPQTNTTRSQHSVSSSPTTNAASILSQRQSRPNSSLTSPSSPLKRIDIGDDLEFGQLRKRQHPEQEDGGVEMESDSWRKYIGTLEVQAWATRPTMKPLKYQDVLVVKRLVPRTSTAQKSSIIRLCLNDREIGRLPEDLTRIFSPLIDQNIADFDVTVLETTKRRLSTGDSFFIQVTIYLKSTGFVKNIDLAMEHPSSKRGPNFNFATESEGEASMRLRQAGVSSLFERLKLKPLKLNNDNREDDVTSSAQSVEITGSEVEEVADGVNLDQLRQFYQANNQSKLLESLPETTEPPKENFSLSLREYQKHGLSWMLAREKEVDVLQSCLGQDMLPSETRKNIEDAGTMNPLWRKYRWPNDGSLSQSGNNSTQAHSQTQDNYFYANLYNGELSLEKPIIKTSLQGGILADEMGLGKTIATLALINSVPYDKAHDVENRYASKTTLIVMPMSLLTQWKEEFEKANNNDAHICRLYYGDETENDLSLSLCHLKPNSKIPIVVITTYGTVLNEYTRISKNRNSKGELPKLGLYSVKFFRIILDEGHNIRNRNTKTAKSVYELSSNRKWVLTGTPIVNRLDDLYSLTKFLELDPWNNFSYWKTFVTLPFEQKKISQTLDVIKSILEPIFLRRTKNQKKNGKPLVELPEKEVVIEEIRFNDQEAKLYNWFKSRAFESFAEGVKTGQLMRQYTQILTHILRLRQVCCHVDLIGGAHEMDDDVIDLEVDEEMKTFLKSIKDQTGKFANDTEVKQTIYKLYDCVTPENECSICTTSPIPTNELTITPCGHTFCYSCILEHLDFQSDLKRDKLCPNCREPISKYKLFRIRNQKTTSNEIRFHTQNRDHQHDYDFQIYLHDPNRTSSKIQALIKHLKQIQTNEPNSKVIVFSQFASYLDILEVELKLASDDFIVYKFDGRLNMNDRGKLLNQFNCPLTNGKIAILLLSLKAGGVGLNLTTASRAFMMDPWWSPSIEDQAIDRIHRIGQNETVKVVRFIMENSIETKMLKIQERKKQIGEAVGVEEEERRRRRIEEIQILFEE
ncbi:RAD5 [Candida theae]|uniref:DNA repair protein RAD5 n=1 Tax=Candida theae TaxID=1198502 RepID=A0AAD5BDA0_9ASCO|nr:RAD5 [Candida theae]KAI5957480.1 RAD5 [Candida theae]